MLGHEFFLAIYRLQPLTTWCHIFFDKEHVLISRRYQLNLASAITYFSRGITDAHIQKKVLLLPILYCPCRGRRREKHVRRGSDGSSLALTEARWRRPPASPEAVLRAVAARAWQRGRVADEDGGDNSA
jgi:hypothetical protein